MVRCLYGDNVCAEVRTQEQAQSFDGVRLLGFTPGEAELGELFVRLQHNHVGTEHDTSLLLLVVVDLYGGIVGDTEGYDPRLVALGSGCGSWATCRQQ